LYQTAITFRRFIKVLQDLMLIYIPKITYVNRSLLRNGVCIKYNPISIHRGDPRMMLHWGAPRQERRVHWCSADFEGESSGWDER
jgi:hypothetical protein